ncbi:MAG: DUF1415 domain-containing protein [Thiohalomonadales bacterium]
MHVIRGKPDPIMQTQAWIEQVVIGCGFCPFANSVYQKKQIRYTVAHNSDLTDCLAVLLNECVYLDTNNDVDTAFVIYTAAFAGFKDYLDAANLAEDLMLKHAYQGVYQLASFHPDYCFAQQSQHDPANYTNRSPLPMFHILRESSLDEALRSYPNPEVIPEKNVAFAREKGITYMQGLLHNCQAIK